MLELRTTHVVWAPGTRQEGGGGRRRTGPGVEGRVFRRQGTPVPEVGGPGEDGGRDPCYGPRDTADTNGSGVVSFNRTQIGGSVTDPGWDWRRSNATHSERVVKRGRGLDGWEIGKTSVVPGVVAHGRRVGKRIGEHEGSESRRGFRERTGETARSS